MVKKTCFFILGLLISVARNPCCSHLLFWWTHLYLSFNSITKRHIILDFKTLSIHFSLLWFAFGFVSVSLSLTSSQSSVQALWFIAHATGSKQLVRFRLLYQSSAELQDMNKHRKFRLNMVRKGHISWFLHLATKRQGKGFNMYGNFNSKLETLFISPLEAFLRLLQVWTNRNNTEIKCYLQTHLEGEALKRFWAEGGLYMLEESIACNSFKAWFALLSVFHSGSAVFLGFVCYRKAGFCPIPHAAQLCNCCMVPWK